jgi:hypothetical protein
MMILGAATAPRAQPSAIPRGAAATRTLRLAWFMYEKPPEHCQDPGKMVAAFLTEKLRDHRLLGSASSLTSAAGEAFTCPSEQPRGTGHHVVCETEQFGLWSGLPVWIVRAGLHAGLVW